MLLQGKHSVAESEPSHEGGSSEGTGSFVGAPGHTSGFSLFGLKPP